MSYLPKSNLAGTENFFVWVNRLDYIFLSCLSMGLIQFRFFPSTKTLARFVNTENIATRAVGNLASDKSAYLKKIFLVNPQRSNDMACMPFCSVRIRIIINIA